MFSSEPPKEVKQEVRQQVPAASSTFDDMFGNDAPAKKEAPLQQNTGIDDMFNHLPVKQENHTISAQNTEKVEEVQNQFDMMGL